LFESHNLELNVIWLRHILIDGEVWLCQTIGQFVSNHPVLSTSLSTVLPIAHPKPLSAIVTSQDHIDSACVELTRTTFQKLLFFIA